MTARKKEEKPNTDRVRVKMYTFKNVTKKLDTVNFKCDRNVFCCMNQGKKNNTYVYTVKKHH